MHLKKVWYEVVSFEVNILRFLSGVVSITSHLDLYTLSSWHLIICVGSTINQKNFDGDQPNL